MLLALAAALPLACAPVTQKVLVFNIEYGGDLVDFGKTVEVIKRAAPDVVLIEEAWGQIPRLARALGWTEYDVRHQVLARRPLLDPGDADARYLFVEMSPGCVAAIANVHLPSDPEPPDVMADAAAVDAAMAVERRTRLRAIEPTLVRPAATGRRRPACAARGRLQRAVPSRRSRAPVADEPCHRGGRAARCVATSPPGSEDPSRLHLVGGPPAGQGLESLARGQADAHRSAPRRREGAS